MGVSMTQLYQSVNQSLNNKQKVRLAKKMSEFLGMTDMGYVEDLLVMAAQLRLKAIKKDRYLYNRNREYFKALRTIVNLKNAE